MATPDLETDSAGAGTDLHNLRAADSQMNSTRNNNEFETGSGNSGLTTNGFYPGDEYKGDVARIIMYMYTRYPSQCAANNVGYGSNIHNSNIPDIFLEWNEADPVSDFETARNNKIAEYQGNRNPFIDNAFYANLGLIALTIVGNCCNINSLQVLPKWCIALSFRIVIRANKKSSPGFDAGKLVLFRGIA